MIQRLIKINYLTKKKIVEMCVVLLPGIGYVRVTNSGLVIMKRHWWSLRRKKIPVTDIIIKYLPIEIGKLICQKDKRDVYISMFNDRVATVVSLTKWSPHMDLLNHVYKEYAKACMIAEPDDIIATYSEPLPVKFQTFRINTIFKSMKSEPSKYKVSDKVNKLKSRIKVPNPIARISLMWDDFLFA